MNPREFATQQCHVAGYSASVIRGSSRRREHVLIRYRISMALREMGYSLPDIGRALNRHHTSVMSLLRGGKSKEYEYRRAKASQAVGLPGREGE